MSNSGNGQKERKKPGPKPGTGGRPRLQFDLDIVKGLGQILATQEEMAAVLGCSLFTIEDRIKNDEDFSGAFKRGQAEGKLALRRAQYQKGVVQMHPTMLIWLGKQWLGQRDQVVLDATIEERTGVAHVPPEETLEYWQEKYGVTDHEVALPGSGAHGDTKVPN